MSRTPEQRSSNVGPREYAPRSSFDPGSLRGPSTTSPDDEPADRPSWRAPEREFGVDFVRFGSRPVPERRQTGRKVFTIVGQLTIVLLIAAACGYLVVNFLARGPSTAMTDATAEVPHQAPAPARIAAVQSVAPALAMQVPRAPARPDEDVSSLRAVHI